MAKKRLMLLGGLRYLLPVIKAAHDLGCHVITCDYLPNNIAHRYSDEYHNVSIIDKEAVLKLAQELQIDGIMSFAVDPGVITAAYVAEKMGLPSPGPYESVCILQNKDRFRAFLQDNGFNCPKSAGFSSFENVENKIKDFNWPLIVKPTDSAGSKGVRRITTKDELKSAFEFAQKNSISGKVIIEEFIEKKGCSSDTDCFSVNGELKFVSFSAQRFDVNADNPYTPSAYSWPSTMTCEQEEYLSSEIQRLLKLLKMQTSIYNVETRVGDNGRPYIMELAPRGGGNRLAEMLRYATGVDLITNAVRAAIGEPVVGIEQRPYKGSWAELILHVNKEGRFVSVEIERNYMQYVVETDIWVSPGDIVKNFNGANDAIGTLVFKFDNENDMEEALDNIHSYVKVVVDQTINNAEVEVGSVFPLDTLSIKPATKLNEFEMSSMLNLHKNTLFLSLGREGFSIIAQNHTKNKKVLLPLYTCQTVCDPFVQLGWDIDTYRININLKIDIKHIKEKINRFNPGVIVFHPYYGTNFNKEERELIKEIKRKGIIIVVDYTQSIYLKKNLVLADYAVGSLRKWFDSPDGGFICSDNHDISSYSDSPENTSFYIGQADSMFLRDCYFKTGEKTLKDISIRLNKRVVNDAEKDIEPHALSSFGMNRLLNSDIEKYGNIRLFNYKYLHNNLLQNDFVKFVYNNIDEIVSPPLYFPIYCKNRDELQKKLAQNKVYAPILWKTPKYYNDLDENSAYIYEHILVIPIDQRYGSNEMKRICEVINAFSK